MDLLSKLKNRTISRLRGESNAERLRARGLQLGDNVYINGSAVLDGAALWLISIGDDSVIGPGVRILAHDATTRRELGYSIVAPVAIGRQVFIGAGTIVLPGVTIGDRAVVGAGSVVREDIPPGQLVVGNPPVIVCSTEDYLSHHREQLEQRPSWPSQGWSAKRGITPERMEVMREELKDGPGYLA